MSKRPAWLADIKWDDKGLVAAIVQAYDTKTVLMMAWMNHEALIETVETRNAVFWSRSRHGLWRKGETSGNTQKVVDIRLDCDGDALLLQVQNSGPACHTGRENCFYKQMQETPEGNNWVIVEPVLIDPKVMYGNKND